MIEFKQGDRILTDSGRRGVVVGSDPNFPLHCLIQFETEERPLPILRSALSVDVEPVKAKRGKKANG